MINLPTDFVQRMQQQLGESYDSFVQSLETPSPVSIRINPFKLKSQPDLRQVPWCQTGFFLPSRPSFTLDPLLHAGMYYVQEPSSMFIEQIYRQQLSERKGLKVLDLCAAPGGKTTLLLSLMDPTGLLVSNEVIRQRSQVLAENIAKWGCPNSVVTCNDPSAFQNLKGFFDVILIDAPCSGEGLFRKDNEAVNEWTVDNTRLCTQRQQRIVANVWDALAEDGILIYSTCTYNPGENEQNLSWISQNFDVEFLSVPLKEEWGIQTINQGSVIGYQFMPHRSCGEGFFISAMRKTASVASGKKVKDKKGLFLAAEQKFRAPIESWIKTGPDKLLIRKDETLSVFPSNWLPELNWLTKFLYPVRAGIPVAEIKAKNSVPFHDLVLSSVFNQEAFPVVDLSYEDALHFIRKDEIRLPSVPEGYGLMTYQNIPIGLIKKIGNRYNNLYPKEWRIRMQIPPINNENESHFLL